MDKICIKDLEVFARHGVFESEKKQDQLFLVSLDIFLDLSEAGRTDDLKSTVNYADICNEISALLKRQSFNLIERCAKECALHILYTHKAADSVTVTVKKPDAPIGKPLAYVAATISCGWQYAYLAIGSNIGNKEENLNRALSLLESGSIQVLKASSYYKTAPVSSIPQDDYLNGAVKIRTLLSPGELLDFLMDTEKKLGRERTQRWGPRTIDLDIILYGKEVLQSDKLTIPHPRMQERLFVLEPLCEIAPDEVHPIYKKRIVELKNDLCINGLCI